MIYIKPKAGLTIYDFDHRCFLPITGKAVRLSPYWQQQLNRKTVVLAATPEPTPTPTPTPTPEVNTQSTRPKSKR